MEWFKHKVASHEDPDISESWDKFGDKAYVIFFVMLEIYGREFNRISQDGWLKMTKKFLARKMRKQWRVVEEVLRNFSTLNRFEINFLKEDIEIRIPKFIELSSNFTKRTVKLPTEATTEPSLFCSSSSSISSVVGSNEILKALEEEKKVLTGIYGYPYSNEQDTELLIELHQEFPDVKILEELKDWKTRLRDKPLKPKSNPRLQLRHWIQCARKFAAEKKQKQARVEMDIQEDQKLLRKEALIRTGHREEIEEVLPPEIQTKCFHIINLMLDKKNKMTQEEANEKIEEVMEKWRKSKKKNP